MAKQLAPQYITIGIPVEKNGQSGVLTAFNVSDDAKEIPIADLMDIAIELATSNGFTVGNTTLSPQASGAVATTEKVGYVKPKENEKRIHRIGCIVRRVHENKEPKEEKLRFVEVIDLYPVWLKNSGNKPNARGEVKDWSYGEFHHATYYLDTPEKLAELNAWLGQIGLTHTDLPLLGRPEDGLNKTPILRDHDKPQKFEIYFKDTDTFKEKSWWDAFLLVETTAKYGKNPEKPNWKFPRLIIETQE